MGEPLKFFQEFDFKEHEWLIPKTELKNVKAIHKLLKKVKPSSIDKTVEELTSVSAIDSDHKQKFFCFICDIKNQLKVSQLDQKIYFEEKFCQNLVVEFKPYIKHKVMALDVALVLMEDFMNSFEIENQSYIEDVELIEETRRNNEYATNCLKGSFKISKCRNLCSKYSIDKISETFIGNLVLYRHVLQKFEFIKNLLEFSEVVHEKK